MPNSSKAFNLKMSCIVKKHLHFSEPFQGLQKQLTYETPNKSSARLFEAWVSLYIACHSAINPVKHLIDCFKDSNQNTVSSEVSLGRTKMSGVPILRKC